MNDKKIENFIYIIETDKNFDQAVVSVLKAVDKKGWTIFQVHDMKERLESKGFDHKPLKIIEICSGKYGDHFLNKDRLISILLPCRINVLQEEGKVRIIGIKPALISQFFPEIGEEIAKEFENDIKEIIDVAKEVE